MPTSAAHWVCGAPPRQRNSHEVCARHSAPVRLLRRVIAQDLVAVQSDDFGIEQDLDLRDGSQAIDQILHMKRVSESSRTTTVTLSV
jgi:hypothetical protein